MAFSETRELTSPSILQRILWTDNAMPNPFIVQSELQDVTSQAKFEPDMIER